MKNKIIWPTLTAIWILVIAVAAEATLMGSRLMNEAGISLAAGEVNRMIYHIFVIAGIISFVLYVVLKGAIKKITDPIEALTEDAKKFKEDQYTHQLRDYDIEELQNLAHAFDYMGDELSGTIRKLRHQKAKLESMFSSLEEGIIVIDKKGYIDETNELARKLLGLKGNIPNNCHITHLLREEQFVKLVTEGLKTNKMQVIELKIGEYIVYITMVAVGRSGKVYEYLLLIKDVTQLRGLEEMKYQFVSNVSHELKTPLTSIQGFVETLQAGAIENKEVAYRFLNIIDIETKRLYRLIQDILLLSEIENMDKQEYGDVKVASVIENCMSLLQEQADKKSVKIVFNEEQSLVIKNMSEDHLTQMMMNLLGNAVRYTDNGAIIITTQENSRQQIITIRDSGIGIPEESIPHIFERFYRVDKGRSRQSGGTGLGLSIVKHIAKLYEIKIEVSSELGEGTCFRLILNKEDE